MNLSDLQKTVATLKENRDKSVYTWIHPERDESCYLLHGESPEGDGWIKTFKMIYIPPRHA